MDTGKRRSFFAESMPPTRRASARKTSRRPESSSTGATDRPHRRGSRWSVTRARQRTVGGAPTSQEDNMKRADAQVGIMLISVALALGACASSATVKSALICENAGGKYVDRVCMPGSPRKAEAMCEGFGGTYSANDDLCKIPPTTL